MRPTLLLALVLMPLQTASASDWKYAGMVPGGKDLAAFYDPDSVVRDGPRVRYWVKYVADDAGQAMLGPVGSEAKEHRVYLDRAADRMLAGYVPPYLGVATTEAVRANPEEFSKRVAEAILREIVANEATPMRSRTLIEMDCGERTFRTLVRDQPDESGQLKSHLRPNDPERKFIAPDTPAAHMAALLCPKAPVPTPSSPEQAKGQK